MKFSYFHQKGQQALLPKLGRGFTRGLSQLSPQLSAYLGSKLLMSPHGKRHYQFATAPCRELNLDTRMGQVHLNCFGDSSRRVLLSHGWADHSASMEALVEALVEQGYQVVALDHVGHGKASGKHSHLPAFIDSLQTVLEHFEQQAQPIEAIVGHSMGGMAALNLPEQMLARYQLILLAVPIDFFNIMFDKVESAGISRHFLFRVLESVTRQYNITWQELSQEQLWQKDHQQVTFFHDQQDKYAPFADVQAYTERSKAQLVPTEGLGHRRIVADQQVIRQICQLLAA